MVLNSVVLLILMFLNEQPVKGGRPLSYVWEDPCGDEAFEKWKNEFDEDSFVEQKLTLYFNEFLDRRNYQEAEKCITKMIAKNPSNPLYHNHRGLCYMRMNEFEKAVDDFELMLKHLPGTSPINLFKALLHVENFERASEVMGRLSEEALRITQSRFSEKGHYKGALFCCNELVKRDPQNKEYYKYRAEIHRKLEDFEAAISDLNTILSPDLTDPPTRTLLAKTLVDAGKIDEAMKEIRIADNGTYGALIDLGNYCLNVKKYEVTLRCCDEILDQKPNHSRATDLRGMYHLKTKAYDRAIEDFRMALSIASTEISFRLHLIEALLDAENSPDATKEMKNLKLEDLLRLSDDFFKKGLLEHGLSCCRAAETLKVVTPTSEIYKLQARCFSRLGESGRALKCFQESLSMMTSGKKDELWLEFAEFCVEMKMVYVAQDALNQLEYLRLAEKNRIRYEEVEKWIEDMKIKNKPELQSTKKGKLIKYFGDLGGNFRKLKKRV